ncbi:head GIN domain-containing protein [Sphingomonas mesophila]|uniref:head GIN domain-containing protein n=1 Tax=Sphingomonas mesophila TaxID=2303576 RepID=UPI0013C2BE12|nr:head GIN domain-containing protein [Sphingomonas mesophila]
MRRLLFATAAMIAVAGCNVGGRAETRDAGPEVSRNYGVGGFDRIEVMGPYDVAVTTGGATRVAASGGANLLDETEVLVEKGALVIRPKKHKGMRFNWNDGKARFAINVEALRGAAIAGSGDVSVDKVAGDFDGEVAGSGSIGVGALSGGRTRVEIAGSGEFTAAGQVEALEVDIAGSGDVDMQGLKARTADISIAGSGNVRANASETAAVNIMGSGDVELGGGAKCTVKKAGSGNVRCN